MLDCAGVNDQDSLFPGEAYSKRYRTTSWEDFDGVGPLPLEMF